MELSNSSLIPRYYLSVADKGFQDNCRQGHRTVHSAKLWDEDCGCLSITEDFPRDAVPVSEALALDIVDVTSDS